MDWKRPSKKPIWVPQAGASFTYPYVPVSASEVDSELELVLDVKLEFYESSGEMDYFAYYFAKVGNGFFYKKCSNSFNKASVS